MNIQQFRRAIEIDRERIARGEAPVGILACSECSIPLQETITGHRVLTDGKHTCRDCYFNLIGEEIDRFPISAGRIRRGG